MRFPFNPAQGQLLVIWFISLGLVFGNGYLILVNHDTAFASDEKAYLSLARGDFGVHIIHRYRVLVPFLAKGLAWVLHKTFLLSGEGQDHHLPIGTAFFLVNSLLMSCCGVVLYRIARVKGASVTGSLLGVMAVLTSTYSGYFTGIALTDSLYLLAVTTLFYAILSGKPSLLFWTLLIGPLAKESFWLFVPFILLALRFMAAPYLLFQLAAAVLVFWGVHAAVDAFAGSATNVRLDNVVDHLMTMNQHLIKLFSLKGLLALGSTYGIFYLLLLAGLRYTSLSFAGCILTGTFIGIIVLHILLSGDIGRMWYFSAPVFALGVAGSTDRIPLFDFLKTGKP